MFSILTTSIYTRHSLEPGGKLTQLQHFTGHVSQTALTWPRVWLGGCVITLTSHSSLYVTSPCCCRAHTESHGVLEVAGSGPAPAAPGTSFTWALALAQPAQPSPAQASIAQPCPVLGHAAPLARASYSAPLPELVGGQVDMLLMSLAPILACHGTIISP